MNKRVVSDWTDEKAVEEISESVCDAVNRLEEARGIAETQWGEKDPRTQRIENAWAMAYTVFKWAEETLGTPNARPPQAEPGSPEATKK